MAEVKRQSTLKAQIPPRIEPYIQPVNGIVQPPVIPPSNRPGRKTNVMEDLKVLLNYIWRIRWSYHFRKPVDAVNLGIPDYHTIIKYPMDLSTIKKRLNNNYYWQADEVLEDFELIFKNCMLYNMEGTPVYSAGKELRAAFYTRLASIDMSNEVELQPKPEKRKRRMIEPLYITPPLRGGFPQIVNRTTSKEVSIISEQISTPTPFKIAAITPPEPQVQEPPPPPPPPPPPKIKVITTVCYKKLDRLIEKSHCHHMLRALVKRKRRQYTWACNRSEFWRRYSHNPNYDHDAEERIDWRILEKRFVDDEFENIESFVFSVRKMFHNALRCFPDDALVKTSVKKSNELFEDRLLKYRELIAHAKNRARDIVGKIVEENKEREAADNNPEEGIETKDGPSTSQAGEKCNWKAIGVISESLPSDTQLWPVEFQGEGMKTALGQLNYSGQTVSNIKKVDSNYGGMMPSGSRNARLS